MRPIPIYDFDLDVTHSKRWEKIFDDNIDKIMSVKTQIKNILTSMGYGTISFITKPIVSILRARGSLFYADEIAYIASRMNMTFDEVLVLQLIYESSSACTSAILKVKGEDLFFRTMDWPMDFLKDITIQLNIKKNKVPIAQGITWIGYVGLLTVTTISNNFVGDNSFGISINYRRTKEMGLSNIIRNAFYTIKMKWPIGYLIRDLIEKNYSARRAIRALSNAQLISPCYITIYVPGGESVILTRDPDSLVSIRDYNLIQTNCDYNKISPNILWSCERRELVGSLETALNRDNSNLDIESIVKKMLIYPIQNDETIYVYCQYKGDSIAYVI